MHDASGNTGTVQCGMHLLSKVKKMALCINNNNNKHRKFWIKVQKEEE